MNRIFITLAALGVLAACGSPDEAVEAAGPAFCAQVPRPAYARFERIDVRDDWFRVYRIAPGVAAIHEPFQWQEVIAYLVEGDDRALLFDTGNGIADLPAVVARLTDKPVTVLNSHSHNDHVGANHAYANILGMDTPFTRANAAGFANEDIAAELSADALCRGLPEGVDAATHRIPAFRIGEFVTDGSIIDLGGRELEVLHVPGHTPDSIALIDREAGLLWTGDSYYTGGIWLFGPATDLEAYGRSLDRLVAEVPGLTALMPAHNEPGIDPAVLHDVRTVFDAMRKGVATRTRREDGLVEYAVPDIPGISFVVRD